MTTTVTIMTADKAAKVNTSTSSVSEDGSYASYTQTTQRVAPDSELTVHVYGHGNVNVYEEEEETLAQFAKACDNAGL